MSRKAISGIDDLETLYPELAIEWHPLLNGTLRPSDVLPGTNRKVYWQCSKCGYVWNSLVCNRAKLGRGCPCCSNKVAVKGINDLATTHPQIAKEWYQPLNGSVTPYDVTHGCGKKYSWLCPRGHVYSATVLHRTSGAGTKCPICNSGRQTSFAEQALFYYVKKVFPTAVNSYKEIFAKGMELDIFIPDLKIGIEYDGVYWHHKKRAALEREQRKYDICKKHGVRLYRVREKKKNTDETPPADWCLFLSSDSPDSAEFNQTVNQVLRKIVSEVNISGLHIPSINVDRDRYEIISYLKGPVKNSIQEIAPDLINEWDYEKNGELKPYMISAGSSQPVYWICSKCRFNWKTQVYKRVKNHTGCPKCAGYVLEKGINDLKTKKPELIVDWDYVANSANKIYPDKIIYNSGMRVQWVCHVCKYKWSAPINTRTVQGNGCIQCGYKSGKELKKKQILEKQGCIVDPLLLKEWDYEKNTEIGLFPEQLTPGSGKSAYWTCSECGHKWRAPIARRSKGAGCRKCADKKIPELRRKTLKDQGRVLNNELLLKEWDYEVNLKMPQEYTSGSDVIIHWVCSKCKFKWSAAISSRNKGAGCPACAGNTVVSGRNDLATRHPELLVEWDFEKNGEVDPSQVARASSKKYWWKCPIGHISLNSPLFTLGDEVGRFLF